MINAAILGIVQGLTEFLPVSSSGHLVLFAKLGFDLNYPGALFEVVVHAGTLLAVLVYFRKQIVGIKKRYLYLIIIGSLPAAVVGFFFQDLLETLFTNISVVGIAFLITGLINILLDKIPADRQQMNVKSSFIVGLAQAAAIIPGVSRSGSTIFTAVCQKIDRTEAARFSFLLSVPAIAGANLLQIFKYPINTANDWKLLTVGFITAIVSGYYAIGWAISLLNEKKFKYFGYYTLILGILSLLVI